MNWKKDKELCRLLMTNDKDDEICCKFFEMYYRNYDRLHVEKTFKIICNGKLHYNKQESRLAIRQPIRIFETVKECDTAADKLVEIFLSGEISDYDEVCSTLKAIYIFIDNTTEKFKYYEKEQ